MGPIDANKLWQNFLDTVQNHYMDFDGRIGRAQFWFYCLVVFALWIGALVVAAITTHLLLTLFALALLLPNLGMTVRRLHDTGKPGIWVLLLAVPLVLFMLMGIFAILGGALGFLAMLYAFTRLISLVSLVCFIALVYFCAQPGTPGGNAFGAVPPVWTPGPGAP
ncbi:MAG TPA: DUF805 domain-containing protein [Rhizomicrobium sp.]|jgi:uncharacterized membrane protein YhaH (DUF805 family)|nr:DUF805 domain-containing protein [Rhizomicrobium sp.]